MNQSALRKTVLSALMLAAILVMNACGANPKGTYTDSSGSYKLELQSGGKATLTTMSGATACTYKVEGKQLSVVCGTQTLAFTIQDDGSLMPPAEAGIGVLKKAKP